MAEYGLLDAQVAVLFGVYESSLATELAGRKEGGPVMEESLQAADDQILARIDADELEVVSAQVGYSLRLISSIPTRAGLTCTTTRSALLPARLRPSPLPFFDPQTPSSGCRARDALRPDAARRLCSAASKFEDGSRSLVQQLDAAKPRPSRVRSGVSR